MTHLQMIPTSVCYTYRMKLKSIQILWFCVGCLANEATADRVIQVPIPVNKHTLVNTAQNHLDCRFQNVSTSADVTVQVTATDGLNDSASIGNASAPLLTGAYAVPQFTLLKVTGGNPSSYIIYWGLFSGTTCSSALIGCINAFPGHLRITVIGNVGAVVANCQYTYLNNASTASYAITLIPVNGGKPF